MTYRQFTSESVAAGHPDKICDQISDAIVDAALKRDPKSRVAVETMVTRNRVVMAGEVTSKAKLNYRSIARGVIKDLGNDVRLRDGRNPGVYAAAHQPCPCLCQSP